MDQTTAQELYAALSQEFDEHFSDPRGLTYITGYQVTDRLNTVLGVGAWSFVILDHGIHEEADEVWALGALSCQIGAQSVVRQQFGSQKVHRRRSDREILDIGFDLKGASTDALKKCASTIGIGLYLYKREGAIPHEEGGPAQADPAPRASRPASNLPPTPLERDVQRRCAVCRLPKVYREGTTKDGRPYRAFFCARPRGGKEAQCSPEFLKDEYEVDPGRPRQAPAVTRPNPYDDAPPPPSDEIPF